MLFFLVLSGSFCYSLHIVLVATLLGRTDTRCRGDWLLALALSHIIGGLLMSPLAWSWSSEAALGMLDRNFLHFLFMAAGLNLLSKSCHFAALIYLDVALVGIFAGITPVATILTSWLLLGELPTAGGVVGILIISFSLLAVNHVTRRGRAGGRKSFTVPEKKGLLLAFFASLVPSFSIVVGKMAILKADPLIYANGALLLMGTGAFIWYFARYSWNHMCQTLRVFEPVKVVLSAIFLAAATFQFSFALLLDVTPHVNAMTRLTILFQVILGYVVAKQRHDFGWRLLWALVMFGGVMLISLSR